MSSTTRRHIVEQATRVEEAPTQQDTPDDSYIVVYSVMPGAALTLAAGVFIGWWTPVHIRTRHTLHGDDAALFGHLLQGC